MSRRATRTSGPAAGRPGAARRRAARRPPVGLTPLLRLVGLIAFAILVIVLLVFWIQSCQGASKKNAYRHYMEKIAVVARTRSRSAAS